MKRAELISTDFTFIAFITFIETKITSSGTVVEFIPAAPCQDNLALLCEKKRPDATKT